MNKQKYLDQPEVNAFIKYLAKLIKGDIPFKHKYYHLQSAEHLEFNSLFDAFVEYKWDISKNFLSNLKINVPEGDDFKANAEVLFYLQKELRKSVSQNNDEQAFQACKKILAWGGVLGSDKKGNKKTLNSLKNGLVKYLKFSKARFENEKIECDKGLEYGRSQLKMNAGFTKIYSLLCDDFIIYDGRVGGALGLLVRKFLTSSNMPFKETLNFAWGKSRPSGNVDPERRNPSVGEYQFRQLRYDDKFHIKMNLRANWILQEIVSRGCGAFDKEESPLRAIEAALFMVGYSVNEKKMSMRNN